MQFNNQTSTFTSFMRATSKAKEAALFLFSVAVLLAGGVAAVRGQSADGFDPNPNGFVYAIAVQNGWQDSYRRRLYNALAQWRSGGHAQPHRPAEPGRHARHGFRPERAEYCPFNRGAGGRQDFSGRRFRLHRRTAALLHRPA